MAKRKPLVLNGTQIQQLQAGDYIGDESYIAANNGEATPITAGMPVYISAADTVKKARANAAATVPAIGLVADATVSAGAAANVQNEGTIALTTAQWDAVAGTSGGLTAGQEYFLSDATAGALITGQAGSGYVQSIGVALDSTTLVIKIGRTTQL